MNYIAKKVKITDIKIKPDDVRRKDLGDIQGLAMSIHKLGLMHPITVSDDLFLLGGERRLTACRDYLKWETIEVRIPVGDTAGEPLDEIAKLEMVIEENAMRKSLDYKEDINNIRAFHDANVKKVGLANRGKTGGWTIRDTAAALNRSIGSVSQALQLAVAIDEKPELGELETQTQALKELKRQETLAAQVDVVDAAKAAGFTPECIRQGENPADMKKLESEKFQLVHMDPPYAIGYDKGKEIQETWGDVYEIPDIPSEVFNTLFLVLKETYRILKEGGSVLCWYHMKHHSVVASMLREAGFEINPVPFYWCKDRHGGGISDRSHSNAVEPCLHGWKGSARKCNKPGSLNWLAVPKLPDQVKVHPMEKPTRLFYPLIENYTNEGDWCYDPYAGSFSFVRACLQLNRNAIGTEMKKDYCDGATVAILKELQSAGPDTGESESTTDRDII